MKITSTRYFSLFLHWIQSQIRNENISLKLHNLDYLSRKNENLNSQPKKKREIQTKTRDYLKVFVLVLLRPIVKNAVLVVLSKVVLPNYLRKLMKLFNRATWKSQKWKIKMSKTVERLFKQNLKWKMFTISVLFKPWRKRQNPRRLLASWPHQVINTVLIKVT